MICRWRSLLLEQVGVSACTSKQESQLRVVLLPYQQPIWLQMALPATDKVACQFVRAIGGWQLSVGFQYADSRLKQFHIKSPFATPFRIFTESAGHPNFIFHPLDA